MFQDMMASAWGGHKLVDYLHGGGSPVIEKVAIYRDHNIEHSKNIAKRLAGIKVEKNTKIIDRESHAWL
jgi:4-hydroxyphenylacetate 3-monooxygenase/4-hydroxybutyryl-CoA dehydratase/vinylacetyl-CoA-Delta-isomerase